MATADKPPSAEPLVLLLRVWTGTAGSGAGWHARLVWPHGRTRDFSSPFELAQFLGCPPRWTDEETAKSGGLR